MYQNYLNLIASVCVTASNILSKEIFSNNTKHQKPISKFHWIPLIRLKTILQNGYTWTFAYCLWTLNFIFSDSDKQLFYQNYLHLDANFCVTASNEVSEESFSNNTKHRKQISKFHWIPLIRLQTILQNGYTWDFAFSLWTLKFIFSYSDKKLLLELSVHW